AKEILQVESQAYEKVIRMMSHEVNNSVGSVNSILDSSIQFLGAINHEKMRDYIEALNVAKGRMSSLNIFTKRFADVVRIPPPDKRNCDLREILNRVLQSYQTDLAEKNITVSVDMVSHVSIFFDIQQLELVLVNIVKNAIQAIFSNGKINIRFKKSPLSLIFENDGEPIPPANQRKLFEPFFTTKKTGQGIGLTLIREILVNHECEFNLHTRQDGITEFKIIFKNIV
ncbi:HAMP domain-containing histidine kinase, partial [candidate division KSB1 bacterium]|nr:HAMP domain-containing histidine kinase [candidate division KSB1 bacterium]